MKTNAGKISQLFLEGLHSNHTQQTFETLSTLVETLENKPDPEMIEVKLVESIYHFMEKLHILESNIKSYAGEDFHNKPGNKLSSLYDNLTYNGDGIYRD